MAHTPGLADGIMSEADRDKLWSRLCPKHRKALIASPIVDGMSGCPYCLAKAAPDLRTACEAIERYTDNAIIGNVETIEVLGGTYTTTDDALLAASIRQIARAALARARGE